MKLYYEQDAPDATLLGFTVPKGWDKVARGKVGELLLLKQAHAASLKRASENGLPSELLFQCAVQLRLDRATTRHAKKGGDMYYTGFYGPDSVLALAGIRSSVHFNTVAYAAAAEPLLTQISQQEFNSIVAKHPSQWMYVARDGDYLETP